MDTHRFTPDKFNRDQGIRHTLRYGHGFEHEDIERAQGIVSDVHEYVKHKTGKDLGDDNFDMGMKFLGEKHEGWKKLPLHQQRDIEIALKKELRIKEPETV